MNLKYHIALIIGFLVVTIASILNIFINLRFGIVYSSRVGHLCHNVDAYLSQRNSNEISIFGTQKKISNQFKFNGWKKNKNIFFNKIGFYGYFFLKNFFPKSKMLIKWSELYPNYSTVMLHGKNFDTKILDKEKIKLKKNMQLITILIFVFIIGMMLI